MNEASIVIMCLIAGAFWAVMAYSVGFKEGERQGYTRGRAVARHAVHAESADDPNDGVPACSASAAV